jgi:hypothetical protein
VLSGTCLCGAVRWRFDAQPDGATACNCTACRRYGALWIYGHADDDVHVEGETRGWTRPREHPALAFHFCPTCGCVTHWLGLRPEDGRVRMAVNLRLADQPEAAMDIAIDHFDGLTAFDDLPRDGRTVKDMWF